MVAAAATVVVIGSLALKLYLFQRLKYGCFVQVIDQRYLCSRFHCYFRFRNQPKSY